MTAPLPRILLVDDDPGVLNLLERMLRKSGFEPTTCLNSGQAMLRMQQAPQDYDVLVTDLNMPGASGLDLARAAQRARADFPVVLLSGHVASAARDEAQQLGVCCILEKSDALSQLAPTLRAILSPDSGPRA